MIDEGSGISFRQLVDAAPDGILVVDAAGVVLLANAEVEHLFGYARDELIGKNIDMLVPTSVRGRHGAHVSGYTSAPRLRPMASGLELSGVRKDGSEIPVEISLSPMRTARGMQVIAGIRDVSDRRKLERDARRANAYLTSAVDAVQDAFALFDEHDRVVMVNSAGRQLLGGPDGAAIVGRPFAEVLGEALGAGVFDFSNETRDTLFGRWLAYHHEPHGTFDVRTGTGRYLRVIERKTAEQGTVAMIADVTGDVLAADELRMAREQAEAASAAKSEFLSSMSHELRTPLNAILGFAQLLERDRKQPLADRQRERLDHVLRGGEHLLRLIDDVLDLSRIEAGRVSISAEPVDACEVVVEVVHSLEPIATRAQVQIATMPLPDLPLVVADRTRLSQILMNFGSNGIKYNRAGGHVTYRAERHPAFVRLVVTDDGIGIPVDKHDRIFEPFQRAGQEAGPIEGTGIGLAISRKLANLMGGSVGFSSTPGRGSEFWIDIAIDTAGSARTVVHDGGAPQGSPLESVERQHLVIYVEDNPSNIAFMRDLIEDLPSVELQTAPSAEIGLDLIRARRPAIVIMDINLPGISGFEAVKRLRASPETRDLPVIALSAAALVKDTSRAKEAGFDRYLTKPIKVTELVRVLEELLPR